MKLDSSNDDKELKNFNFLKEIKFKLKKKRILAKKSCYHTTANLLKHMLLNVHKMFTYKEMST